MAHTKGHGKILIVDDEPSIRSSLKMMLKEAGYTPAVASDGGEAIEKLEAEQFDVVLLDLVMEPVGGMDVLKMLHEHDPKCAVIVMTGFATIESAISTLKLGAYDYLLKPFKPDELFNIVKRAVEWRELELELSERERELRESRRRYQTLFEETSDAVVVFDRIGRILDANTFATRLFGYSKDELLEMSFFDLYAEKDRYTAEQVFPSALKGYSAYFEIEFKRKEGSPIVGEMSARRIELDGERVFQAVIRDVTNRKRVVEEALVAKDETEQLMRLLCTHLLSLVRDATRTLSGKKPELSDALDVLGMQQRLLERALVLSEVRADTKPLPLDDAVKRAMDMLSHTHPDVSVDYEPTDMSVLAGDQLADVLLWVLEDAAARGAGHIHIAAERLDEGVRTCITDDTSSPCPSTADHIELQLANVAVRRWNGKMSIQERHRGEPESGCTVCIVLGTS
ncbi:MAG: response regulator [Methermicoccaceae archaeon]